MFKFSKRSLEKLQGVDTRLILLANEVLKVSPYDFGITCGYRTIKEQQKMYERGVSRCDGVNNKSKHQLGKAIDIMVYDENGKGTWKKDYYIEVAKAFKQKAKELDINIRWGGDFKSIVDMPHFELC